MLRPQICMDLERESRIGAWATALTVREKKTLGRRAISGCRWEEKDALREKTLEPAPRGNVVPSSKGAPREVNPGYRDTRGEGVLISRFL